MKAAGGGVIVDTSSIGNWMKTGSYSFSKGGVNALTVDLSQALGPLGIRVNVITLGTTATEGMQPIMTASRGAVGANARRAQSQSRGARDDRASRISCSATTRITSMVRSRRWMAGRSSGSNRHRLTAKGLPMNDMIKAAIDRCAPAGRIVIGERDIAARSGGVFAHINHATGEHQADVPLAGKAEVEQAISGAKKAFAVGRRVPAVERREKLARLAALIESRSNESIRLTAIEGGTPATVGAGSPRVAVEWTNHCAGWADKIEAQVVSMPPAGEAVYTGMGAVWRVGLSGYGKEGGRPGLDEFIRLKTISMPA